MEKIKKIHSLKWRILLYIPIPFALAVFGSYAIGYGSNALQTLYQRAFFTTNDEIIQEITEQYTYEVHQDVGENGIYLLYTDENGALNLVRGDPFSVPKGKLEELGYVIVSDAQIVLIPLWVFGCMAIGSFLFYKREMEGGLTVLVQSSEKIAENELDFEMPATRANEIGQVCKSFDKMRSSLLKTSKENVRMMEEARRLNAAFSHDIRTPITVMKGYVELMEKYVPEGNLSQEKQLEILEMMHSQVERMEHYAQSMSSIQKLEDLTPNIQNEDTARLIGKIEAICQLIDARVKVLVHPNPEASEGILLDKELVFEVVENLVSNAARYAKEKIQVEIECDRELLQIAVWDDGEGFSEKILHEFGRPFLREDKAEDKNHFGLGIYISKLLCEKCGGNLTIENREGAYVKASFQIV